MIEATVFSHGSVSKAEALTTRHLTSFRSSQVVKSRSGRISGRKAKAVCRKVPKKTKEEVRMGGKKSSTFTTSRWRRSRQSFANTTLSPPFAARSGGEPVLDLHCVRGGRVRHQP